MTRITSLLHVVITLLVMQSFSQDSIPSFLAFPDSAKDITAAARRSIIHYFQKGHIDSVDMVITYCDTLSTVNDEWLSGHERILIELLKGNLALLSDPSLYKKHLSLHDTAASEEIHTRPPLYDPYHQAIPHYDNLAPFLLQNFHQKVAVYKTRYPEKVYLWEFLDIVFNYSVKKVIRYVVNYPDSPFTPLVRYNYFFRYAYRHHGIMGGIGYSFLNFGKDANAFYKDRTAFIGFVDTYLWGYALTVSLTISTRGSLSGLIIEKDTIPVGTSYRDVFFDVSTGHIISIRDRVYLTPYVGGVFFHTTPHYSKDVSLPLAWGAKIGLSTNIRLAFYNTEFIISAPKPDLAVRVDMGYRYNKFYRIRHDLGINSFYITLALEIIRFGYKRVYDVD